jgi:phosphoribosylglycinamide formyltransferase-1
LSATKRVGVLISGRGSNLQALIDAARVGELGAEVALVISNVAAAAGLESAKAAGIPTSFLDHRGRAREDFDREATRLLEQHRVDLVCLAGFMRLLSSGFVRAFVDRVVNVHPSLLPAFPGQQAQRQAFEHGVKVTGATVHLVDAGLDSGPIVLQEAVPVLDTDDVPSLTARILAAEHRIYPRAVAALLSGRYRLEGRRLVFEGASA